MTKELNIRMVQALSLLALTGCATQSTGETDGPGETEGVPPYEPAYDGDYGDCDPEEIDAVPTRIDESGDEEQEVLLCDTNLDLTEAECLGWEGTTQNMVVDEKPGDWIIDETLCGPAWLDEQCCFHVLVSWDDTMPGRPFLVDREARVAGLARHGDWTAGEAPAPVPEDVRPALVDHWIGAGLAEHASVAAFSRFSLVLLHLGAPPDLVSDAHRAALDEVRHAELCFGLASHYGGTPVGPGPLDVADAMVGELDPKRIFETLFLEGCVGETLAALEAAEAARQAADPVVAEILRGIAEDEQRHAALAWRAAAWLLARHPDLGGHVAALIAALPAPSPSPSQDPLAGHGGLSAEAHWRVRQVGVREVVLPLARSLLRPSRIDRGEATALRS